MTWRELTRCTPVDIIKNLTGILVSLLVLVFFLSACSSADKHEVIEAKVKTYDTIAEMEEQADLIVTGHKQERIEDL